MSMQQEKSTGAPKEQRKIPSAYPSRLLLPLSIIEEQKVWPTRREKKNR